MINLSTLSLSLTTNTTIIVCKVVSVIQLRLSTCLTSRIYIYARTALKLNMAKVNFNFNSYPIESKKSVRTRALKRYLVFERPRYLIINLKRFS